MDCGVIECGVMGTLRAQSGSKRWELPLGMGGNGVGGTLWGQGLMGTHHLTVGTRSWGRA